MQREAGLARAVAVELGLAQYPIRAVVGSGSVNHVFVMGSGDERWVVRFAMDPLSPGMFEAEAWCARQAAERGVPTAAVTASGVVHGVPYGVQRFVSGRLGHDDASHASWSVLGCYGRVINDIKPDRAAPGTLFSRFGRDLEQAWLSHLEYNLEQLTLDDPLLRQGVYSRDRQRRLGETLGDLVSFPFRFGLSHGDLTPRNLIEPDTGSPVLIDWGCASFGPVPWTDLLTLDRDARHAGGKDTHCLDAFLSAMDLNREAIWPTFEKFRQIQLLDLVRWAAEQRPERLPGAVDDLLAIL